MLKLKKFLTVALFVAGSLSANAVASNEKTIQQLMVDLKTIGDDVSSDKVMNLVEGKIQTGCGMTKIDLVCLLMLKKSQGQLFNKLAKTGQDVLEQCASSIQTADNALEQSLPSTQGTASPIYNPGTPKAALIENLFECSKLNIVKDRIALLIKKLAPDLKIGEKEIEKQVTNITKKNLNDNFTETEILELVKFFKSTAFQSISQHANEFVEIIITNSSPDVAKKLRQIC